MDSSRHPGKSVMNERLRLTKICPYNSSHKVMVNRFGRHLLKCRREYLARQQLNGKSIDMLVCQYSYHHIVVALEICYHEENCPDKETVRSHQLNLGPLLKHVGAEKSLLPDIESYRPDPQEQKELFGGFHLGQIIGTYNIGKPQFINDLKKMSTEEEEEQRNLLKVKYNGLHKVDENVNVVDEVPEGQTKTVVSSVDEKEKVEGAAGTAQDDSEDEDWGKECKPGPAFDYVKNIWNPKVCHHYIPPGLTKSEKKLFLKIHGKKMEERRLETQAEYEAKQDRERQLVNRWQNDWETVGFELDPVDPLTKNEVNEMSKMNDGQPGFQDGDFEYY